MKITITKDQLEINFSTTKKILSMKGSFKIPDTIVRFLPIWDYRRNISCN